MKEEITRINKMVAEGRLSPEDAADLIDAFYASDRTQNEQFEHQATNGNGGAGKDAPPPPPPGSVKEPFKAFVESMERLTKEGMESVNWQEVANQARDGAKKGFDAIRTGFEDLSKGKVHFGWLGTHESKEVSLPLASLGSKVLKIDNPCGSVKIVGGFDVGSVTARAKFRASTLEEAKAKALEYTLIVEESDHQTLIRQPDVSGLSVDLEIQLCGTGSVDVRNESGNVQILDTKGGARVSSRDGDIQIRGLIGAIEVSVDSGNVSLEDVAGTTISVENKSGNLTAARVRGNITARAASGEIAVVEGSGRVMSLETVSGNVTLDVDEPVSGALNVRTVSGNASVTLPDLSDCRVSLSTLRGNVSSNLGLKDEARTDTRLTGRLGDGSGTLDVSAVTGDVTLELRGATVSA